MMRSIIVIHLGIKDFNSFQCFLWQHVDIAALLIKFNTCVNAVDRWGFTPLHEAAQKGRTQLCSLLVRYQIKFIYGQGVLCMILLIQVINACAFWKDGIWGF